MISLQGNVDWFCFWLKSEEDPDPAKGRAVRTLAQTAEVTGRKREE